MVLRDGLRAFEEGFCDRAYRPDGGLVDRATPGAVLAEPRLAAAQALSLARGAVVATDGSVLTLWVDTLCIHGDSPGRSAIATAVRRSLADARDRCGRAAACMTRSIPVGEVRLLGDRALLIGVVDAAAARAAGARARQPVGRRSRGGLRLQDRHGPRRATPTRSSRRSWPWRKRCAADLIRRGPSEHRARPGRLLTVPCRFDGPDLAEVAALAGCGPDEVAALLTAQPLTAAVVGFSPGFAYLEGLPSPLDRVPRRPRPRPVVPAGSVAIANGQAAVYPTASPGGWHLVGRTGVALFSPERAPYAVLAPGDTVRFTVAGVDEAVEPDPVVPPPWSLPAGARTVLEVVAPGLRAVRAGRRAPGRCRGGRPRGRSGRPGVVRAGQPTGRQRGRRRRARTHGGRDPAALPRRVPRGRGGGCAGAQRRRHCRAGRPAPAAGAGPGAPGRSPARAGAAPICRWRAASSGPSGSGAPPRTS